MTEKEYAKLVKDMSPKSPIWKDCLNAFWIGGLICALGQLIMNITVAVRFMPELTTVSRAYPITWTLSSIVLLIYFCKADWIHNFDRMEAKGNV